jgi:CxxC motif-containing protein (DUF1111 family)
MSVTPQTRRIGWLDRGSRATHTEATDHPRARTRSMVMWALIALVPGSSAGWLAASRQQPRSRIAVGSAAGPERGAERADRLARAEAPAMSRAPSPDPAVPTPEPGAPATCSVEFDDPPRKDEGASPPASGPDTTPGQAEGGAHPSTGEEIALGRTLFDRRWRPDDPRCHGGDGLGPVFNATSCLDCHRQGGPGGGGPARTNAELVTVVGQAVPLVRPQGVFAWDNGAQYVVKGFPGNTISDAARASLVKFHPVFADTRSIVLHRSGVDPEYDRWRQRVTTVLVAHRMQSSAGRREPLHLFRAGVIHHVALHKSQRNPTALFGAGLIDSLPAQALYEAASKQLPEIRGRVPRVRDGGVGRFGWKAQTATLRDFVLSACANELGLEVPGHHQAASPLAPGAGPRGLDLTGEESDALVAYVRSLPTPAVVVPSRPGDAIAAEDGRRILTEIDCADCHTPSLGSVQGIYSDLLLHDMGEALGDPGSYYGSAESPGAATHAEWRTPPLWGVRDSGPYLHDGRAQSLEDAVVRHGGQGAASAHRFGALAPRERSRVKAFLNTLVAPAPDEVAEASPADGDRSRAQPPAELARRAETRLHLGQSLERMGKPEGAVTFYREVVGEAPDSLPARVAAGRIAVLTGSAADRAGHQASGSGPGEGVRRRDQ